MKSMSDNADERQKGEDNSKWD